MKLFFNLDITLYNKPLPSLSPFPHYMKELGEEILVYPPKPNLQKKMKVMMMMVKMMGQNNTKHVDPPKSHPLTTIS